MKDEYNGSNNKVAIYLVGLLLSLQSIVVVIPMIEVGQYALMMIISFMLFTLMMKEVYLNLIKKGEAIC